MTHSLYYYSMVINRVVDGDTLDVTIDLGFDIKMTDHLRLYDVDTPEVYGPNAEPAGKVASQFTKDWVAGGTKFYMDSRKYNAREKYGRALAEVYRDADPVSLNQALIAAGQIKHKP